MGLASSLCERRGMILSRWQADNRYQQSLWRDWLGHWSYHWEDFLAQDWRAIWCHLLENTGGG